MNFRRQCSPALWLALLALTVAVSGCHRDKSDLPSTAATATATASSSASASPTPTPVPTIAASGVYAQSTLSIVPAGGSLQLASGGFTGTFTYPSNTSTGTDTGSLVIDSNAPVIVPSPSPSGTPLLYFLFLASTNLTFSSAIGITTLTLPSGTSGTGIAFTEMLYDTGGSVEIGTPVTGVVSSSGQSVTFPSVSDMSFAATGGDGYLMVISTTTSS